VCFKVITTTHANWDFKNNKSIAIQWLHLMLAQPNKASLTSVMTVPGYGIDSKRG
jgi:hypothetical protein